jgi:uncharacterized membrane protein YbhN (UPF0104 family)
MTHARWKTLARLVTIPLVVGGVALIVRRLDGPTVMAALRNASWPLVGLAFAFIVLGSAAQLVRTQQFLRPAKHIPLRRLVRYQLAAGAATNLLPARAGEALRAYPLRVNEDVPVATTAGLVVGEYAVKAVTLLALAAPVPWLVPLDRLGLSSTRITWTAVAIIAVALAAVIVYRRAIRGDAPRWLRDLVTSLRALASGRQLAAILVLTTLAWLTEAVSTILVARALGHALSLTGALLVLVTLNVALSVPSTPGRVGVFELGAVFGLRLLGIPDSDAVLIALLSHLIQFLPTTLFGLAGLPLALAARKEVAPP